jgi:hypothetical protein
MTTFAYRSACYLFYAEVTHCCTAVHSSARGTLFLCHIHLRELTPPDTLRDQQINTGVEP